VLRAALRDPLPTEILTRRKPGFRVPFHAWFRDSLSDQLRDTLASGNSSVVRLRDPLVPAPRSRGPPQQAGYSFL
jgi:hypothetical protein